MTVAIRVIMAPLGQSLNSQELPSSNSTAEARTPAANDTSQLVCAT